MTAPLAGEALRRFVVEALHARRGQARLLSLTLPAPALAPEAVWAALGDEPATLWQPPDEATDRDCQVGLGEVPGRAATPWTLTAVGGLHGPIERLAPAGQAPAALRWLGGLRFAESPPTPPWLDFADDRLHLPRWHYCRGPGGSQLHLLVYAPTADLTARVEDELGRLLRADTAPRDPAAQLPLRHAALPPGRWQDFIARILAAIDAGEVEKVVAARHSQVGFAQPIAAAAVLARLRAQAPQSFRFALRRGASTFLGASPERLLRKHQRTVETEALAGTLARRPAPLPELAAQLLGSDKDRREHALVVRAICDRLAPLCEVDEPAELEAPQVRVLPHLLHLHTPLTARTRRPSTHVMELAAALHPTPAVGGTPTAPALQLIAAHEPQARGHYAGPVGWYDEHGDGEFAVAIRSGVLIADTAFIYGGAGIVRGSDPGREYAETAAKMRPLLDALAVPPSLLPAVFEGTAPSEPWT
jgi:isochorismate synthase